MSKRPQDYDLFVEKFVPKKTTDDCYTPPLVFAAVRDWVRDRYGICPARIVRPFQPGGDYRGFSYPPGSVVVDNPPFSILSEIVGFYAEHGIPYFLFCPGQTGIGYTRRPGCCFIGLSISVIYDNGAVVNTSFLTSLEGPDTAAKSEPELYRRIDEAVKLTEKAKPKKQVANLAFPPDVINSTRLGWLSKYGSAFSVDRRRSCFIRRMDNYNSGIFGSGLLLSVRAAAERAAAERAAAERAAAERAAAERAAALFIPLSDREREIQKLISKGETA